MGEYIFNIRKWQKIDLQNLQTAHVAQQQQKNNQKMGRRPR